MSNEYVNVGFTGARKGMTDAQVCMVAWHLRQEKAAAGHHGDCIGSDANFHTIARTLSLFIEVHPPQNDAYRAHCVGDLMHTERPYIVRNRRIVDLTDLLIATPAEMPEQPRGGTWSTVRYARTIGRRVIIILPDGSISA